MDSHAPLAAPQLPSLGERTPGIAGAWAAPPAAGLRASSAGPRVRTRCAWPVRACARPGQRAHSATAVLRERGGRDESGLAVGRAHKAYSCSQRVRTGAQVAHAAPLTVASLSAGVEAVRACAGAPPGDGVAAEPARPLLPAAAAGRTNCAGGVPAHALVTAAGAAPVPGSGLARPLLAAARPGWGAGPGCVRALAAAAGLETLGGASAPAGAQLVSAAADVGARAASTPMLAAAAAPSACGS